jgi:hypothetical protein
MRYFKHSTSLRKDPRMMDVLEICGMEGYAVYLRLMEIMCLESGWNGLPLIDEIHVDFIVEDTYTNSAERLFSIIDACAKSGLFDESAWIKSKTILSPDLSEQYQQWLNAKRSHSYRKHEGTVFKRDGFKCVYCGSEKNLSLDHVIPQSRGGPHTVENLATCCKSCNSSKRDRTPQEWLGGQA